MANSTVQRPMPGVVMAIAWVVTYFVSRTVLKSFEMGQPARIAVELAPAIPCGLFLLAFIRNIRKMDELERKVQTEALAFAFPLSIFLLMFLGLLQLAVELSPDDWSYRHVWVFLPLFYFIGLALAWRRYK